MRWLAVALSALVCACSAPEPPPNLVLVIGDDHGWTDFGFMGSRVAKTPNLDRLAAEGTVFRVGYSSASVCRPSMRTLLTGLLPYQWSARVAGLRAGEDAPEEGYEVARIETLPRLLRERGYASFQGGKLWEASSEVAGFDEGMTTPAKKRGFALVRRGMEEVFDFIDRHEDRPFFLWFAPYLPHKPHFPREEYTRLYAKDSLPFGTVGYFGNVSWFDDGLGRLVAYLEEKGLRERTLIVYVADNGWEAVATPLGFGPDPNRSRADENVAQLGGPRGKASLYEMGMRTPIVVSWPGVVPAGRVIDTPVSTANVFPTLLDYAGIAAPGSRSGRSLRPVVEDGAVPEPDRVVGIVGTIRSDTPEGRAASPAKYAEGGAFLRDPSWHYIWYFRREHELYAIEEDPLEERNVAAAHPKVARRLRRTIVAWARAEGIDVGDRSEQEASAP